MGRTVKDSRRVEPKPVQKIVLSEHNSKKRLIAAGLFLIIGVSLLVYCFVVFLNPEKGWATIEANQTENNSVEFVFQYNLGASGNNVNTENRAVTALYNQSLGKIYQLLDEKTEYEGVTNVFSVNQSPNTELIVDEALYDALAIFSSYDSRYLYMAPIFLTYDDLFYCTDDAMIFDFDPLTSEAVKSYFGTVCEYINDPEMIDIQLMGDNKIKLFVSEEYLKFAEDEGITEFISFSWLKNAFEVDYIADVMIENGFKHGYIASYDGFTRNFDESPEIFSLNIFDRYNGDLLQAATMSYSKPMAIVYFKGYPLNALDVQHYYTLENGEVRTPYLDADDGIPKCAVNTMISYSGEKSCAETLLGIMNVFINETVDNGRLSRLKNDGVFTIYCDEQTVFYNEEELMLTNIFDLNGIVYKTELFN